MGVNQNEENRDILTHNQVVVGSNPTGPTLIIKHLDKINLLRPLLIEKIFL